MEVSHPVEQLASTLSDGLMEKPAGQRRSKEDRYAPSASRLSADGDSVGITTERSNVPLDPLQGSDLVKDAIVARYPML